MYAFLKQNLGMNILNYSSLDMVIHLTNHQQWLPDM